MILNGGRHRVQHGWRSRLPYSKAIPMRSIAAVLLEDGGWYVVVNFSFSVAKLRLTDRSQSYKLGPSFYFLCEGGGLISGQLTSIRAVRQHPKLLAPGQMELLDDLLTQAEECLPAQP